MTSWIGNRSSELTTSFYPTPRDPLVRPHRFGRIAARARHHLYRGAARALDFFTPTSPATGAAHGVTGIDRGLLAGMQADLAVSATATRPVLALPSSPLTQPPELAVRLHRAAAAARLAWDLLATHLAADGLPRTPDGERIRGQIAKSVLADTLLLTRGITGLDTVLEPALWQAALHPDASPAVQAALRQTAFDCQHVIHAGLPAAARQLAARLASRLTPDRWRHLDTAATATTSPVITIRTPADAAGAVHSYYTWLIRHAHT